MDDETTNTTPDTRPTLADRLRELDLAITAAVTAATAACGEAHRMYREAIASLPASAPDTSESAAIYGSVLHLGEILGDLRKVRGRL
jgi:hypothetical protein